MLPIWPDTDRIPVWFWLLAIAALFAVGLLASMPGFDMEAAVLRLRQSVAGAVLAFGLFQVWRGGRVLWRLCALREHGVEGEAEVTDLHATRQRSKRSGPFAVGRTILTQYFLAYRLKHPGGETICRPMRIDRKLAESLRQGGTVRVRYLPDRPHVSAPVGIAVRQVELMRTLQLVAGLALMIWSTGWLAPGVLLATG